jgi:hypothetical protein
MDTNDKQNLITDWEEQRAILKEKLKKLAVANMDFAENKKNEMLGKLALKLGITTTEIRKMINHFVK